MNRKFLLFGAGIGGNYGLDAIVLGTERIVHRSFPDGEVWLPALSWKKTDYRHVLGQLSGVVVKNGWRDVRLAYVSRRMLEKSGIVGTQIVRACSKLVGKADCVLSIGGDLYTFADKETNWPYPYSIVEAGNKIIARRKPYVVWCASVGPLEKAGDRLGEIVDHLSSCTAIIVREHDSYSYLRETLGLSENVHLAADPAFVMEPQPFDMPFLHTNVEKSGGGDKLLAVNFSRAPIDHVLGEANIEKTKKKLVEQIQYLLDRLPLRVLFVPHVGSDFAFLSPIVKQLTDRYPRKVAMLPKNLGARRTKWAISQCNALLTMRFHCSLAGFSTATPTMILVSTTKGAKICREMYGDLQYALNIKDTTAELLLDKIKNMLDNEEAIRAKLAPACKSMEQRAFHAGSILRDVL